MSFIFGIIGYHILSLYKFDSRLLIKTVVCVSDMRLLIILLGKQNNILMLFIRWRYFIIHKSTNDLIRAYSSQILVSFIYLFVIECVIHSSSLSLTSVDLETRRRSSFRTLCDIDCLVDIHVSLKQTTSIRPYIFICSVRIESTDTLR